MTSTRSMTQQSPAVSPANGVPTSAAPTAEMGSYERVRSYTEALAAPLGPEDQVVQSMPDASPTKWHRAHTTWFFEEFVLGGHQGYEPFDADFSYLFNSYYEAVGPRQPRPRRGMITRPDVTEVGEYRRAVDSAMATALGSGSLDDGALELVELGLHHEQQHQELLLMDALHLLSQNPTSPAYADSLPHGVAASANRLLDTHEPIQGDPTRTRRIEHGRIEHGGGLVEIGHEPDRAASPAARPHCFAYDNEGPRHKVWLEPFAIDDRLVTCGEWLEFIEDGGYSRADLWLSNGWNHARANGWEAPLYWRSIDDSWQVFGLTGLAPLDPAAPVANVSYFEADAYAHWKGARLPGEAEWEVAASSTRDGAALQRDQFFGALWQWTRSAYEPYPGFRPAAGAVGEYNGKFMVDQQVLRGSSYGTSPGHERVTYRNFFPAAARWAFCGVRIAHDER